MALSKIAGFGDEEALFKPSSPLTSCVTLSRSAASLGFSPLICFLKTKQNKKRTKNLVTLRQVCRLCTAQRHQPREQVGDSSFLICPSCLISFQDSQNFIRPRTVGF